MLSKAFQHVVSGVKDDIDEQFSKTWPLIYDGATHLSGEPKSGMAAMMAATIFKAYYRTVYRKSANYGGIIFVCQQEAVLTDLRQFICAFVGLRDITMMELRADTACPAMRNSKDAVPFMQHMAVYGLPFSNMMSWDVSNLTACCLPNESVFMASTHPSKWDVRASNNGEILRLEDRVSTVFDLNAEIKKAKAT